MSQVKKKRMTDFFILPISLSELPDENKGRLRAREMRNYINRRIERREITATPLVMDNDDDTTNENNAVDCVITKDVVELLLEGEASVLERYRNRLRQDENDGQARNKIALHDKAVRQLLILRDILNP